MKKAALLTMLTIIVWAASLPIKLAEYESRGEPVRVYIYKFWNWIPALLEPDRAFSDAPALFVFFAILDLFHILLCFAIAWMGHSLYSRYSHASKLP